LLVANHWWLHTKTGLLVDRYITFVEAWRRATIGYYIIIIITNSEALLTTEPYHQ